MNRYREISDFAKAFAAEYAGFMKANGVTNLQIAEVLGRNDGYVSERKSGKRPLDLDDVDALASLVTGWTGRTLMIELARRARVNGEVIEAVISDFDAHVTRKNSRVGGASENAEQRQEDYARAADEWRDDESGEDTDII